MRCRTKSSYPSYLISAAAAGLLLGCLGGESNGIPPELVLNLSVKGTPECQALKQELAVATGDSAETLLHDFAVQCVEEHPSDLPAEGETPEPAVRCEWIAAEIEGGHEGLQAKYAYYCPEHCSALSEDPEAHAKFCVLPQDSVGVDVAAE